AFQNPNAPLYVEIGFGLGEDLISNAKANPGINFIGIETLVRGIIHVAQEIERSNLANVRLVKGVDYELLKFQKPGIVDCFYVVSYDCLPMFFSHEDARIRAMGMERLKTSGSLLLKPCPGSSVGIERLREYYFEPEFSVRAIGSIPAIPLILRGRHHLKGSLIVVTKSSRCPIFCATRAKRNLNVLVSLPLILGAGLLTLSGCGVAAVDADGVPSTAKVIIACCFYLVVVVCLCLLAVFMLFRSEAEEKYDETRTFHLATDLQQYPEVRQKIIDALAQPDFHPAQLIDALKKNPKIRQLYEAPAGVREGYAVEEHTLRVMKLFEEYFTKCRLPLNIMRLTFALHDIGKSLAVRNDELKKHAQYTERVIREIFPVLPVSGVELQLIITLIKNEAIDAYLNRRLKIQRAVRLIREGAEQASLPMVDFFRLLTIYFQVDAGAYAMEPGSLAYLFAIDRQAGDFVFNEAKGRLTFSRGDEERFCVLEEMVNRQSPPFFSALPLMLMIGASLLALIGGCAPAQNVPVMEESGDIFGPAWLFIALAIFTFCTICKTVSTSLKRLSTIPDSRASRWQLVRWAVILLRQEEPAVFTDMLSWYSRQHIRSDATPLDKRLRALHFLTDGDLLQRQVTRVASNPDVALPADTIFALGYLHFLQVLPQFPALAVRIESLQVKRRQLHDFDLSGISNKQEYCEKILWAIYDLGQRDPQAMEMLIRTYPAIFASIAAERDTYLIESQNILRAAKDGKPLCRIIADPYNRTRRIQVYRTLEQAVRFPEVHASLARYRDIQNLRQQWSSSERNKVSDDGIREVLCSMPEALFSRIKQEYILLPRIFQPDRGRKEELVSEELRVLDYVRSGGEVTDQSAMREQGFNRHRVKTALQFAVSHPVVLLALNAWVEIKRLSVIDAPQDNITEICKRLSMREELARSLRYFAQALPANISHSPVHVAEKSKGRFNAQDIRDILRQCAISFTEVDMVPACEADLCEAVEALDKRNSLLAMLANIRVIASYVHLLLADDQQWYFAHVRAQLQRRKAMHLLGFLREEFVRSRDAAAISNLSRFNGDVTHLAVSFSCAGLPLFILGMGDFSNQIHSGATAVTPEQSPSVTGFLLIGLAVALALFFAFGLVSRMTSNNLPAAGTPMPDSARERFINIPAKDVPRKTMAFQAWFTNEPQAVLAWLREEAQWYVNSADIRCEASRIPRAETMVFTINSLEWILNRAEREAGITDILEQVRYTLDEVYTIFEWPAEEFPKENEELTSRQASFLASNRAMLRTISASLVEQSPKDKGIRALRNYIGTKRWQDVLEKVLASFLQIPRHLFMPQYLEREAYDNKPLYTGFGQPISQPSLMEENLIALDIKEHEKVLEIGTDTGWLACLMAKLGKHVYTLEIRPNLARRAQRNIAKMGINNVTVIQEDGSEGYLSEAPYDVIVVSAGSTRLPSPLVEQLNDGGRILIPIYSPRPLLGGCRYKQMLFTKRGGKIVGHPALTKRVEFVELLGKQGWPVALALSAVLLPLFGCATPNHLAQAWNLGGDPVEIAFVFIIALLIAVISWKAIPEDNKNQKGKDKKVNFFRTRKGFIIINIISGVLALILAIFFSPTHSAKPQNIQQTQTRIEKQVSDFRVSFYAFLDEVIAELEQQNSPQVAAVKIFRQVAQENLQIKKSISGDSREISQIAAAGMSLNFDNAGKANIRLRVDVTMDYLERLLALSKDKPVYRDILIAIIINGGATLEDIRNYPLFYANLALQANQLNRKVSLDIEKQENREAVKRLVAGLIEGQTIGYRQALRYLQQRNITAESLSDIAQSERDSWLRTVTERLRLLLGANEDELTIKSHLLYREFPIGWPYLAQLFVEMGILEGGITVETDSPGSYFIKPEYRRFLIDPNYINHPNPASSPSGGQLWRKGIPCPLSERGIVKAPVWHLPIGACTPLILLCLLPILMGMGGLNGTAVQDFFGAADVSESSLTVYKSLLLGLAITSFCIVAVITGFCGMVSAELASGRILATPPARIVPAEQKIPAATSGLRRVSGISIEEDDISGISLSGIEHQTLTSRLQFAVQELGIYPQADRSGFLRLLLLDSQDLARRVEELRQATARFDFIADYTRYPRLLLFDELKALQRFAICLRQVEFAKNAEDFVDVAVRKLYPERLISGPAVKTEPISYKEVDASKEIASQKRRNRKLDEAVMAFAQQGTRPLTANQKAKWRELVGLITIYLALTKGEKVKKEAALQRILSIKEVTARFTPSGRILFGRLSSGQYIDISRPHLRNQRVSVRLSAEGDLLRICVYQLGDNQRYVESFYYNDKVGRKVTLDEQLGRWLSGIDAEPMPQQEVAGRLNTRGALGIWNGSRKIEFVVGREKYLRDAEVFLSCRMHRNGQKIVYVHFNPGSHVVAMGFMHPGRWSIQKIFGPNNNQQHGRSVLPVLVLLDLIRVKQPLTASLTPKGAFAKSAGRVFFMPFHARFEFAGRRIHFAPMFSLPQETVKGKFNCAFSPSGQGRGFIRIQNEDGEEIASRHFDLSGGYYPAHRELFRRFTSWDPGNGSFVEPLASRIVRRDGGIGLYKSATAHAELQRGNSGLQLGDRIFVRFWPTRTGADSLPRKGVMVYALDNDGRPIKLVRVGYFCRDKGTALRHNFRAPEEFSARTLTGIELFYVQAQAWAYGFSGLPQDFKATRAQAIAAVKEAVAQQPLDKEEIARILARANCYCDGFDRLLQELSAAEEIYQLPDGRFARVQEAVLSNNAVYKDGSKKMYFIFRGRELQLRGSLTAPQKEELNKILAEDGTVKIKVVTDRDRVLKVLLPIQEREAREVNLVIIRDTQGNPIYEFAGVFLCGEVLEKGMHTVEGIRLPPCGVAKFAGDFYARGEEGEFFSAVIVNGEFSRADYWAKPISQPYAIRKLGGGFNVSLRCDCFLKRSITDLHGRTAGECIKGAVVKRSLSSMNDEEIREFILGLIAECPRSLEELSWISDARKEDSQQTVKNILAALKRKGMIWEWHHKYVLLVSVALGRCRNKIIDGKAYALPLEAKRGKAASIIKDSTAVLGAFPSLGDGRMSVKRIIPTKIVRRFSECYPSGAIHSSSFAETDMRSLMEQDGAVVSVENLCIGKSGQVSFVKGRYVILGRPGLFITCVLIKNKIVRVDYWETPVLMPYQRQSDGSYEGIVLRNEKMPLMTVFGNFESTVDPEMPEATIVRGKRSIIIGNMISETPVRKNLRGILNRAALSQEKLQCLAERLSRGDEGVWWDEVDALGRLTETPLAIRYQVSELSPRQAQGAVLQVLENKRADIGDRGLDTCVSSVILEASPAATCVKEPARRFLGWLQYVIPLFRKHGLKGIYLLLRTDLHIFLAFIKEYGLIKGPPKALHYPIAQPNSTNLAFLRLPEIDQLVIRAHERYHRSHPEENTELGAYSCEIAASYATEIKCHLRKFIKVDGQAPTCTRRGLFRTVAAIGASVFLLNESSRAQEPASEERLIARAYKDGVGHVVNQQITFEAFDASKWDKDLQGQQLLEALAWFMHDYRILIKPEKDKPFVFPEKEPYAELKLRTAEKFLTIAAEELNKLLGQPLSDNPEIRWGQLMYQALPRYFARSGLFLSFEFRVQAPGELLSVFSVDRVEPVKVNIWGEPVEMTVLYVREPMRLRGTVLQMIPVRGPAYMFYGNIFVHEEICDEIVKEHLLSYEKNRMHPQKEELASYEWEDLFKARAGGARTMDPLEFSEKKLFAQETAKWHAQAEAIRDWLQRSAYIHEASHKRDEDLGRGLPTQEAVSQHDLIQALVRAEIGAYLTDYRHVKEDERQIGLRRIIRAVLYPGEVKANNLSRYVILDRILYHIAANPNKYSPRIIISKHPNLTARQQISGQLYRLTSAQITQLLDTVYAEFEGYRGEVHLPKDDSKTALIAQLYAPTVPIYDISQPWLRRLWWAPVTVVGAIVAGGLVWHWRRSRAVRQVDLMQIRTILQQSLGAANQVRLTNATLHAVAKALPWTRRVRQVLQRADIQLDSAQVRTIISAIKRTLPLTILCLLPILMGMSRPDDSLQMSSSDVSSFYHANPILIGLAVASALFFAFGLALRMTSGLGRSFPVSLPVLKRKAKHYLDIWFTFFRKIHSLNIEFLAEEGERHLTHVYTQHRYIDDTVEPGAGRYSDNGLTVYDMTQGVGLVIFEPGDNEIIGMAFAELCCNCTEIGFIGKRGEQQVIGATHYYEPEKYRYDDLIVYFDMLRQQKNIAVEGVVVGFQDSADQHAAISNLEEKLSARNITLKKLPRPFNVPGTMVVAKEGIVRYVFREDSEGRPSRLGGEEKWAVDQDKENAYLWSQLFDSPAGHSDGARNARPAFRHKPARGSVPGVFNFLLQQAQPLTKPEIAERLGLQPETIAPDLRELQELGLLKARENEDDPYQLIDLDERELGIVEHILTDCYPYADVERGNRVWAQARVQGLLRRRQVRKLIDLVPLRERGEMIRSVIVGAEVHPVLHAPAVTDAPDRIQISKTWWWPRWEWFGFAVRADADIFYALELEYKQRRKEFKETGNYFEFVLKGENEGVWYHEVGNPVVFVNTLPSAALASVLRSRLDRQSLSGILLEVLNVLRVRYWFPGLVYYWMDIHRHTKEIIFYPVRAKGDEERVRSSEREFIKGDPIVDFVAFNKEWQLAFLGESGLHYSGELVEKLFSSYRCALEVSRRKGAQEPGIADELLLYFDGILLTDLGQVQEGEEPKNKKQEEERQRQEEERLALLTINKFLERIRHANLPMPSRIKYANRHSGTVGDMEEISLVEGYPIKIERHRRFSLRGRFGWGEPKSIGDFLRALKRMGQLSDARQQQPQDGKQADTGEAHDGGGYLSGPGTMQFASRAVSRGELCIKFLTIFGFVLLWVISIGGNLSPVKTGLLFGIIIFFTSTVLFASEMPGNISSTEAAAFSNWVKIYEYDERLTWVSAPGDSARVALF
ncbi:MAG: rRNA adenine N-6-methyltransferase family protein, partial [Bacteroidales bacterium]